MRGNLQYKLHAGQKVIEEAYRKVTKKLFVANCARRFGKTFWACVKCVECAIACKNARPRIKYASATRLDLEEFVLPAFNIILEDCPEELRPHYRPSKNKFIFPNGAEIQIIGLDKRPDGGRGNYCDLYVFEEAGLVAELKYLYGSVIGPMTVRRPGARIIMISTPPSTPAHPFQEFCQRAQRQDAYTELNIFQNPLMTEKDILDAHEECLDESEWLREYMCQFIVDSSKAIIPEWDDEFATTQTRPDYFEHLHRYDCMDLGVKIDLTALIFGYFDSRCAAFDGSKGVLWVEDEDEINGPTMNTLLLRDMIQRKESELWKDLRVYRRVADNNNPLLLQDLAHLHKIYFVPTNKDELHAMVNELRVFIKRGKLRVSPKCQRLLGCLRYGVWNNKRDKFDRSPLYGHYDHLAALVYLIRNLDQATDPVPDAIFVNNDSTFLTPRFKKEEKKIADLKKIFNLN